MKSRAILCIPLWDDRRYGSWNALHHDWRSACENGFVVAPAYASPSIQLQRTRWSLLFADLLAEVPLVTQLVHLMELRFQPIDVLFFVLQQPFE